jgi:hypothetical protein
MKKLKKSIKEIAHRMGGFRKSIVALTLLQPQMRTRVFYGYGHYKYATKYANLRNRADGKRYYVIPIGDESLLVANRLEIQYFKDKGSVKKSLNCNDLYKYAYYMTPINRKFY